MLIFGIKSTQNNGTPNVSRTILETDNILTINIVITALNKFYPFPNNKSKKMLHVICITVRRKSKWSPIIGDEQKENWTSIGWLKHARNLHLHLEAYNWRVTKFCWEIHIFRSLIWKKPSKILLVWTFMIISSKIKGF